jgi:hypothetical protein
MQPGSIDSDRMPAPAALHLRTRAALVGLVLTLTGACTFGVRGKDDLEPCQRGEECNSERCANNTCFGTFCRGDVNCAQGTRCEHGSTIFGGKSAAGTCLAPCTCTCEEGLCPCAECPSGYSCGEGSCLPPAPTVELDAPRYAALGEPVTFRATASSPNGTITGYTWRVELTDIPDAGAELTWTFDSILSKRVVVSATDEARLGGSAEGSVIVTQPKGSECTGFQPCMPPSWCQPDGRCHDLPACIPSGEPCLTSERERCCGVGACVSVPDGGTVCRE